MLLVILLSIWSIPAAAGRTNFHWQQGSSTKFLRNGRSLKKFQALNVIGDSHGSTGRLLKNKEHTEPSVQGDALLKASYNGNITIVKQEIRKGIDPNIVSAGGGSTPLILAAANGHSQIVKFLLKHGADIEAKDDLGYTALLEAALWGETEVVKALVKNGAEVDVSSGVGSKPLFVAAKGGHLEIVEVFLHAGAGIEERMMGTESTPLLLAAEMGKLDVVEVLLNSGADVTAKDQRHATALHYLSRIRGENSHIISAMLENGADIDGQSQSGWTPLHFAAWNGQNSTIHALVEMGADKMAVDEAGRTAKDAFCLCLDPGDSVGPFCDVTTCKTGEEQRNQIVAILT
ncbi:hypothetical protein BSKO_04662 [Bryopsis sp. KO-2023]|nr:hypothetical protein BSKO_04662 [Bryopsis sp. KO-2023]